MPSSTPHWTGPSTPTSGHEAGPPNSDGPLRRTGPAVTGIAIRLIHNHTPDRCATARPAVARLAAALTAAGWEVVVGEVTEQESVDRLPFTVVDLLRQRLLLMVVGMRWRHHLGASWAAQAYYFPFGMSALGRDLLLPTARRAALRRAFIERAIRHKHEQAWREALAASADWCLVCEDDIQQRSSDEELMARVATLPWRGDCALLVLSGSCEPGDLSLDRISSTAVAAGRRYRGFVTNGMVCYALHRRLLLRVVGLIDAHPWAARLPSDWLLNWCLLRLDPQDRGCTVIADPEVFVHGSRDGSFPSLFA